MTIPEDIIARACNAAIEVLIDKYDSLGMRASGKWADELVYEIQQHRAVIKGMDYTQFLTHGRPPSEAMPPVDAIYQWMLDKQTFAGEKTRSRAWAIAKSIQASGTSWYKAGGSDLLEVINEPRVQEEFARIVGEYIVVYVSDDLVNYAKSISQWS